MSVLNEARKDRHGRTTTARCYEHCVDLEVIKIVVTVTATTAAGAATVVVVLTLHLYVY